jgi:hypothetical protein
VMMVTGYGDDERRRLAGEYGATEFITKPVDFNLLKTHLREVARNRTTLSEDAGEEGISTGSGRNPRGGRPRGGQSALARVAGIPQLSASAAGGIGLTSSRAFFRGAKLEPAWRAGPHRRDLQLCRAPASSIL